jgi:hypothetical protein
MLKPLDKLLIKRWKREVILLLILALALFIGAIIATTTKVNKELKQNQKPKTNTKLTCNFKKSSPLILEEIPFPQGEYPKPEPPKEEIGVAISTYQAPIQFNYCIEQWRPLVQGYFGAETDNAMKIMNAEGTGGNPTRISPTCDYGLMQINCCHADKVGGDLSQLLIPEVNIRVAYAIWQDQNWYPWTTRGVLGL